MFFALVVMGLIMVTFVRIINHALSNPQDKSFPGFGQETGTKADAPTADDDFEPIPFDDDEPKVQAEEPVFEDEPVMQQSTPEEPEPVMAQPAMDYSSFDRLFGLIGKPLAHSTSKTRFNTLFQREHLNAYYENFELDSAEQVKQLIENNPNLCGFNVTIPYKQDIIPLLDRLDETAKTIGAINTVKVMRRDGKTELVGYNTDWIGFNKSFGPLLEGHRKALILGTGGVSKAVKYALDTLGIENRFVSRNSNFEVLGYYELSPSVMDDFDVIVNCTPMGMWPHTDQCPDIPYTFLSDRHLLLDVIANPDETLFMKKGREHGATAKGGKDMLEQQAVAAWDIWNRIGE